MNIPQGSWVHVHNMKTGLGDLIAYTYHPEKKDIKKENRMNSWDSEEWTEV